MINRQFTVVMYHYVRNLSDSKYPEIKGLDLKLFKEQLSYLKKNYSLITINDVIDAYNCDSGLPNNAVILTFDDGYLDHYSNVFPILHDMKIQGNFYPPASPILDKTVLDVNKIHFILATVKNKDLIIKDIYNQMSKYRFDYELQENSFYYKNLAVANRFDNEKVIFIKRILQVGLVEPLRQKITDYLFKKYVSSDESDFSEFLYMSSDNIKEMIENNMHFGSHGYKHYWLSSLSKSDQELEISKSLDFLSKVGAYKGEWWTMCYPYGDYNSDTIDLLKKYNCQIAFTTEAHIAHLRINSRYMIPRLDTNDLPKK